MHELPEHLKSRFPLWGEWSLDSLLGEGPHGRVYRIRRDTPGRDQYAVLRWMEIGPTREQLENARAEAIPPYEEAMRRLEENLTALAGLGEAQHLVECQAFLIERRHDTPMWDVLIRTPLYTPFLEYMNRPRLTVGDAVRLGSQITTALTALRGVNVPHLNIHPGNLFVTPGGDFLLGEAGLMAALAPLPPEGRERRYSPYAAPEVVFRRDPDTRADIYALGMVLYLLLNGLRPPFAAKLPQMTNQAQSTSLQLRLSGQRLPPPLQGNKTLKKEVVRACAYAPEKRFETPEAFHAALGIAAEQGGLEEPLKPPQAALDAARKKPKAWQPLLIIPIVLAFALGMWSAQVRNDSVPARSATARPAANRQGSGGQESGGMMQRIRDADQSPASTPAGLLREVRPAATPSPAPEATAEPAGYAEMNVAVLRADTPIYASPSAEGEPIGILQEGSIVSVQMQVRGADGPWRLVLTGGKVGYVPEDALRDAGTINIPNRATEEPDANQEVTPTPPPLKA